MKTQYYTATSLDGFIADEHHSLDWLFQFDAGEGGSYPEFMQHVGAMAMGSSTYEWLLRNHVYADPEHPKPWPHEQATWVFTSRELTAVPGADIRFVRGDVAPVHAEMRSVAGEGRNIWIAGGGDLAAQFHRAGLLDEVILTFAPVFLRQGAPVFGDSIIIPPLRMISGMVEAGGLLTVRLEVQRPF